MDREVALRKLQDLVGKDLRPLADQYDITVFKYGKKNKGWAGQVIERYLDIPLSSAQAPNFGSWELKLVSFKRLINGQITPKETMQITMIDGHDVVRKAFEDSHLYAKLRKVIICGRLWESTNEERSLMCAVTSFDLTDPELYNQIKSDYELVREVIRDDGFQALSGNMGVYVQPRTKGPGHGSRSRAFYARTKLIRKIFDFEVINKLSPKFPF